MDDVSTFPRVVVIWRGSDIDPGQAARYEARLQPVIDALRDRGFSVDPLVYFDRDADAVRNRLRDASGILVWVNPLADGQPRGKLNLLLCEASRAGVFVSAHPDVIDAMGTKRVLFTTRNLGWGSDVKFHVSPDELDVSLAQSLAGGSVRVLKPLRGNDGLGVIKVSPGPGREVIIRHAHDDKEEALPKPALLARLEPHFSSHGGLIDQAFNETVGDGMVRCYMVRDRVAGFARQHPRAPSAGASAFAMASAKAMHGPDASEFADLRQYMESNWVPALRDLLDLGIRDLPVLWDADFLLRAADANTKRSRYMLCEINVSCVSPFPDTAPDMIAAALADDRRQHATAQTTNTISFPGKETS
jgi:hypothetical protein